MDTNSPVSSVLTAHIPLCSLYSWYGSHSAISWQVSRSACRALSTNSAMAMHIAKASITMCFTIWITLWFLGNLSSCALTSLHYGQGVAHRNGGKWKKVAPTQGRYPGVGAVCYMPGLCVHRTRPGVGVIDKAQCPTRFLSGVRRKLNTLPRSPSLNRATFPVEP